MAGITSYDTSFSVGLTHYMLSKATACSRNEGGNVDGVLEMTSKHFLKMFWSHWNLIFKSDPKKPLRRVTSLNIYGCFLCSFADVCSFRYPHTIKVQVYQNLSWQSLHPAYYCTSAHNYTDYLALLKHSTNRTLVLCSALTSLIRMGTHFTRVFPL